MNIYQPFLKTIIILIIFHLVIIFLCFNFFIETYSFSAIIIGFIINMATYKTWKNLINKKPILSISKKGFLLQEEFIEWKHIKSIKFRYVRDIVDTDIYTKSFIIETTKNKYLHISIGALDRKENEIKTYILPFIKIHNIIFIDDDMIENRK